MRSSLLRLGAGWLLMLAGMAVMFDSGISGNKSRATVWLATEALFGFVVVVAGAVLRRRVIRGVKNDANPWPRR